MNFIGIFFICLTSLCLINVAESRNDTAITRLIDNLFRNYDKRIRPVDINGTLSVGINCYILDVFDVDETKHEFTVNMYLRHHWSDTRMKYTKIPGVNFILLDAYHKQELWTPDTYILNERSAVRHSIGNLQEYTKILPNGFILQSARITVKGSCRMDLGYFPFDRQLCILEFSSYSNIGPGFDLSWIGKQPALASPELYSSTLNFRFGGIRAITKNIEHKFGNQTTLGLEFFFSRHSTRYLQDVYFPIFILTLIAFCTLYIGPIILRVQLSTIMLIGMILLINLNSSWMPKVSYQTAMDVYVFISTSFIFVVVLVNLVKLNFQKLKGVQPQHGIQMNVRKQEVDFERCNDLREHLCDQTETEGLHFNIRFDDSLQIASTFCNRFLPISYCVFNIIYWMVVLIGSSWYPEGFITADNIQE